MRKSVDAWESGMPRGQGAVDELDGGWLGPGWATQVPSPGTARRRHFPMASSERRGSPAATVTIIGLTLLIVGVAIGLLSVPRPVPIATVAAASTTLTEQQVAVSAASQFIGRNAYDGWCLQFVADAWKSAGQPLAGSPTAYSYWTTNPNHWQEHSSPGSYNGAPEGALLFWGPNQWNADGHVAIAADSSGNVISTSAYPYFDGIRSDPRVFEFNIGSRSATVYHYLGWMIPGTGSTPTATPVPTPAPAQAAPPAVTPPTTPTVQPVAVPPNPGSGGTGSGQSVTAPVANPPSTPVPAPANNPSEPTTVSPPAPTPTLTAATYAETAGGIAHTWSDPADAGGTEGPTIGGISEVQISCKINGFRVADGDTWWYQIAQSPWSNDFYVSADAFYNNGSTSGSLLGTPFVDLRVPDC